MKYLMATIASALFWYCVVVAAGAIWGGANMIAPCSGGASSRSLAERIIGGAIFGTLFFAVYGAVPSITIGALTSPIVVWLLNRMQHTQLPPE